MALVWKLLCCIFDDLPHRGFLGWHYNGELSKWRIADRDQESSLWKPKNIGSDDEPSMQLGTLLMDNGSVKRIYSNKEVFPRELSSNVPEAVDESCYVSIIVRNKTEVRPNLVVESVLDKANSAWTVEDLGIGMMNNGLVNNFGDTAKPLTRGFMGANSGDAICMTGFCDVGYYSAHFVTDEVRESSPLGTSLQTGESSCDDSRSVEEDALYAGVDSLDLPSLGMNDIMGPADEDRGEVAFTEVGGSEKLP